MNIGKPCPSSNSATTNSKIIVLVSHLGLYGKEPDIQSVHIYSSILHLATASSRLITKHAFRNDS
jgi:hypothetical protein